MPVATFENPDGEEIAIDADEVVRIAAGIEEETTLIELEDGDEILVYATQLEVIAELGLNPLEYIDPAEDDVSIEALVGDEDYDEDGSY